MLFLKIYTGFSLFVFILFELKLHSIVRMARFQYGIKPMEDKDRCGISYTNIKILLACFVPLMNVTFLFLLLFKSEVLDEIYKSKMEEISKSKGDQS